MYINLVLEKIAKRLILSLMLVCSFVQADVDFYILIRNNSQQYAEITDHCSLYAKANMPEKKNRIVLPPNGELCVSINSKTPQMELNTLDCIQINVGGVVEQIVICPSLLDEDLIKIEDNTLNLEVDCFQYGVGRVLTIPSEEKNWTMLSYLLSSIKGVFGIV